MGPALEELSRAVRDAVKSWPATARLVIIMAAAAGMMIVVQQYH